MSSTKREARGRRHRRVRKKVRGTPARPRLSVFRSSRHIYAQVIDDVHGRTVAAASTAEGELRSRATATVDAAKAVGKLVGERAKAAGSIAAGSSSTAASPASPTAPASRVSRSRGEACLRVSTRSA
jgi:large subunit ribosomal protein L18